MTPKVLSPESWDLVRRLVAGGHLDSWTLAGATGLALQLGHRYSEDLDFFRTPAFESEILLSRLSEVGPVAVQSRSSGTLHLVLEGLRVSFLAMEAPLLFPGTPYRGLALADPRDIAVMKLVAIGGRGSRKDFVDLFFYLQAGGSLEAMLELTRRRFEKIDFNEYHLLKSLVFFDDAEAEPMPRMLREVSWQAIKSQNGVLLTGLRFQILPILFLNAHYSRSFRVVASPGSEYHLGNETIVDRAGNSSPYFRPDTLFENVQTLFAEIELGWEFDDE